MFFLFGSASVDLLSLNIDVPRPPGKGPRKWLYLVRRFTLMPSQKNWPLSSICGRPTPTTVLAIIETVTSEVIAKSILEGTCGAKIQKEGREKRRLARLGRKQDVYIVLRCIFIDRISNTFPPLSWRTPERVSTRGACKDLNYPVYSYLARTLVPLRWCLVPGR